MKKTYLVLFAVAALVSCNKANTLSDATKETGTTAVAQPAASNYGMTFSETNVLTTSQLAELVTEQDSLQATVTGEISSSCQSKGCWLDVKLADNQTIKVTFRDYGFFVPVEDLSGKTVVFTGTAKRTVTSVETQRHYAEDAGKTPEEIAAITSPKEELSFVADGLVIK